MSIHNDEAKQERAHSESMYLVYLLCIYRREYIKAYQDIRILYIYIYMVTAPKRKVYLIIIILWLRGTRYVSQYTYVNHIPNSDSAPQYFPPHLTVRVIASKHLALIFWGL